MTIRSLRRVLEFGAILAVAACAGGPAPDATEDDMIDRAGRALCDDDTETAGHLADLMAAREPGGASARLFNAYLLERIGRPMAARTLYLGLIADRPPKRITYRCQGEPVLDGRVADIAHDRLLAVEDRLRRMGVTERQLATTIVPPPDPLCAVCDDDGRPIAVPEPPAPIAAPPPSTPGTSTPAAAASPGRAAATPVPARSARRPARGAAWAQLGAFRDETIAVDAWAQWEERLGSLIASCERVVVPVDLGPGRGVFHRLGCGGFSSRAAAEAFCRRVRRTGRDCIARPPNF